MVSLSRPVLGTLSGSTPSPAAQAPLTRKEAELLAVLFENAGRCLSREFLLGKIWGYKEGTRTRTLDVHVQRLRSKLGAAGLRIVTVLGAGYMWQPDGRGEG